MATVATASALLTLQSLLIAGLAVVGRQDEVLEAAMEAMGPDLFHRLAFVITFLVTTSLLGSIGFLSYAANTTETGFYLTIGITMILVVILAGATWVVIDNQIKGIIHDENMTTSKHHEFHRKL